MEKLETFDEHLEEQMKNKEFAQKFFEEKRRLGLAIKLAEFRQKEGLSQTELAKRSGISQQQLSKLELGENCNINTLLKVCSSLGIELLLRPQQFM